MDRFYWINFFSTWHCGSGLGVGADLDAVVIRDADGFPFVPGKTIKGLLREAAMLLTAWGDSQVGGDFSRDVFGEADRRGHEPTSLAAGHRSVVHFTDALLTREQIKAIGTDKALLFAKVARTAIGEHGQALAHSLRRVEVSIPLRLRACIHNLPATYDPALRRCFAFIKELGVGRNRGLGRCEFEIEEG